MILKGHTYRGLYEFLHAVDFAHAATRTTLNAELKDSGTLDRADRVFDLWHQRLRYPSINVVNYVLKLCNVSVNNQKRKFVCFVCQ